MVRPLMFSRILLVLFAILSPALAVAQDQNQSPDQQTLQVVPLQRDGEVLVSFKLDEALTDDVRALIHSGLTIKFVYKVDLKRTSAVWLDRTIVSGVVMATVRYDTLTRLYHYSRVVNGAIEFADTTEKEDVAWKALREFERLSLFRGTLLEPNAEYYLRVTANASPRNSGPFVWPWRADDALGFGKFTFVR